MAAVQDDVMSLRAELQRLSEDLTHVVIVDSARHKQCVDAANLEGVRAVRISWFVLEIILGARSEDVRCKPNGCQPIGSQI